MVLHSHGRLPSTLAGAGVACALQVLRQIPVPKAASRCLAGWLFTFYSTIFAKAYFLDASV